MELSLLGLCVQYSSVDFFRLAAIVVTLILIALTSGSPFIELMLLYNK